MEIETKVTKPVPKSSVENPQNQSNLSKKPSLEEQRNSLLRKQTQETLRGIQIIKWD